MTTAEIVKLREMYQGKADRAYRAYQETGTQAYQWQRRTAADGRHPGDLQTGPITMAETRA